MTHVMKEFDENEAVRMMKEALPADESIKYSDDEMLNLIDIIWDYYEQNGLLDVDLSDDDDDEVVISELVDYAKRMLKKDRNATLNPEMVELLVEAELAYEDSLLND